MRAAYEAELSRITSADMILQSAASLLNIGGLRLGLGAGFGRPSAIWSRCATRSTPSVGCCRCSSAARRRVAPAARRALSAADGLYARDSEREPSAAAEGPVGQPAAPEAPASQSAAPDGGPSASQRPSRQPRRPRRQRVPARPSPAAGCGCRGAEQIPPRLPPWFGAPGVCAR